MKRLLSKKEERKLMRMFERMAGALAVFHMLDHGVMSEDELDHDFFDHLEEGDYSFLFTEDEPDVSGNPEYPTQ